MNPALRRLPLAGALLLVLTVLAITFVVLHVNDEAGPVPPRIAGVAQPAGTLPLVGARSASAAGEVIETSSGGAVAEALVPSFSLLAVSERGAAVAGATVRFELGSAQLEPGLWPAVGRVVMDSNELGLAVSAPGWQTTRRRVTPQELHESRTDELRVVMSPQDVKWGRVLNAGGEPRGGELLRLVFSIGKEFFDDTVADLDGWFPYPATSSNCKGVQLVGSRESQQLGRFQSRMQSISIRSQEPLVLEVQDKPGVWLSLQPDSLMGRSRYAVQHLDPQDIAGTLEAFSTRDGVFLPLESDGLHRLRVGTVGWVSDWLSVSMQRDIAIPDTLVVPMSPRPALRGRVVDPAGVPVADAWVAVDHWPAGRPVQAPLFPINHRTGGLIEHEWHLTNETYDRYLGVAKPPEWMGIVQTDVGGAFELPFQLGILVVHHPAFAAATFDVDELPAAPIVLGEGCVLEGEVVGEGAVLRAAGPISIEVQGPGFPGPFGPVIRQIETVADDGRFRLPAMRQGRNTVTAKSAAGERMAKLKLDIAPEGVTSVTVPVVQVNRVDIVIPGSRAGVARVELSSLEHPEKTMRCTRADEVWSAGLDWSGLTTVQAFMGGPAVDGGTIDVVPGQKDYTVRLPDATVRFAVDLAGLAGTYSLDVRRENADEASWYSLLGPEQTVDMPHVMPGRYVATMLCNDGQPAPGAAVALKTFDVAPRTETMLVELRAATRTLECEVRGVDGSPLDSFRVSASSSTRPLGQAVTDGSGRVTLDVPLDCTVEVYGQSQVMNGLRAKGVGVAPSQASVELIATRTAAVELKFVRPNGSPYTGPDVDLEYLDGDPHGFGGPTRVFDDGLTGMIPLCPGRWIVHVSGGQAHEIQVAEEAEQTVVVQVSD